MANPNRFRAGKNVSVSKEGRSNRSGTGQVHSRQMGIDLNPPTNLSAISAETSVTVSFTAPAGDTPTNFSYALSTNGGSTYGAFTALSPADAVSPITISGLTSNQSYVVKLKSLMGGEESGESTTASFTTLAAAPTSLSASNIATFAADISFTQGTGGGSNSITNYKYALSTNGGSTYGAYIALSPTDSTSPITITGLSAATSYTVKIRPVTAAGDGSESAGVALTTLSLVNVDFLVLAGGGPGGVTYSGGGGAGGLRSSVSSTGGGASAEAPLSLTRGASYVVTVGAGGVYTSGYSGSNGSNSVFHTITSLGGDAARDGSPTTAGVVGCGAGGSNDMAFPYNGSPGTTGQGYGGGTGYIAVSAGNYSGGGGGGTGGAGGNSGAGNESGSQPGNGGSGSANSITGTSVTRGGGGGGGGYGGSPRIGGGDGGSGGGGATGTQTFSHWGTPYNGGNGGTNLGGGGGATGTGSAGQGGSGVVIIRYVDVGQGVIGAGLTGSTSTYSSGGVTYRVYSFTAGTGTFTLPS